jgi:hypothetical protein
MEIKMLRHSAIVDSTEGSKPVRRQSRRRFFLRDKIKNAVVGLALALTVVSGGCSSGKVNSQTIDGGAAQISDQKAQENKRYKARFRIRSIPGLRQNVRYWSEIYRNPHYRAIIAENHSRDNLRIMDFSKKWTNRPPITRRANIEKFILNPLIRAENRKRRCLDEKEDCTIRKPLVYKLGMRERMEEGASQYTQWRAHVEEIFAQKGLPPYLAALMIVESQCKPLAKSYSAAVGPYQLTPVIVKEYNLYREGAYEKKKSGRKKWVYKIDERMNWMLSAFAAAQFLENLSDNLKKEYGDVAYPLSSSAYHAGLRNLKAALKNSEETLLSKLNRKPSPEEIFAHAIYSPQFARSYASDSKDYPPQLYAAVDLLNNLPQERIRPTKEFELVLLVKPKKIKLSTLVEKLDISKEEFLELNPQYNPKMFDQIILGGNYKVVRFLAPKGSYERVLELEEKFDLGKTFTRKFYARTQPSKEVIAACENDKYCSMDK